jgi:hypothetical protein
VIDPLYVAAREALLDALDALGDQREALILAGAQAIYIHTGAADLAVAEFTTDGDLVVNPAGVTVKHPPGERGRSDGLPGCAGAPDLPDPGGGSPAPPR